MEFRILGPLEASDAGNAVPVVRPKQRAMLTALLLRPGQTVSVDRLLDDLWGESPPPSARASLQNAISMLRKLLGAGVVVTRPGGYALEIEPDQVDVHRFERLVAEARELPPDAAAERLREALALWRGPALADVAFEAFAEVEASRLEELRAAAREELAEAELARGRHEALVPELEALVAEHPYRERARAQLMLALYRAGRQADALAAYQEARRFLDEELGLEPGRELEELQRAILTHDESLGGPARSRARDQAEPAQRRTVTVLFAELAGSGALAAELDPEAFAALLRRWHEAALAAVERHGGRVEATLDGAVVASFGAQRRHEDDALRAARAALDLREGLRRLGGDRARIGVATGETVVGGEARGIAGGYVVNVAAKLAREADDEEVRLAAPTFRLVRDSVAAEPLGALTAAPGAPPIPVFGLRSVTPAAVAVPRRLDAPLVGRTRELAALRRAFAHARRGGPRLATLLGEPGVGKSRLAAELAAGLAGKAHVLVGKCVSYGEGATYVPVAEIVRRLVPDASEHGLAALLAGDPDAGLVARRVREVIGLEADVAPGREGFWAVGKLLDAAARRRPLLLVVEDAHWAEPTLLDLLSHLAERKGGPLLVLCIARPELRERVDWPVTIELAPLGDRESAALVAGLPQERELPATALARVVELAGGNPLFAEQLVAFVSEAGESALGAVPPTLEGLIASRIDRLPQEARPVLEQAAVLGREFPAAAVETLCGSGASDRLAELVAGGLIGVAGPGALAFQHVLVRDVAYAGITKQRRSELHELAADWLDAQAESADETIGYHLEQAHACRVESGLADRHARRLAAEAGERLGSAGVRAWRVGDARAATSLLGRAASLLPGDHAPRPELLRELGSALWASGDPEQAATVLAEAVAAAAGSRDRGTELRGRVDLAYLRLFESPEGGADGLLDLAVRAIPVFEALDLDRHLGWTWLTLAFVHGGVHGRYRAAEEAAERSLAHYRRLGWVPATCLRGLASALYHGPAPVGEALSRCHELLQLADRGGGADVSMVVAGLEAMRGRPAEARRLIRDAQRAYDELGWGPALREWAVLEADVELAAGNLAAAEQSLRESCAAVERSGQYGYLATRAGVLAGVLYDAGKLGEADRWSRRSEESAASDDVSAQLRWRSVRAKLEARRGASRKARAVAAELLGLAEGTDGLNERAGALLDVAEVARLGGRDDEAARFVEDAVRLYEQKGNRVAARRARARARELSLA